LCPYIKLHCNLVYLDYVFCIVLFVTFLPWLLIHEDKSWLSKRNTYRG
jgi:hypothetical protein